MSTTFHEPDIVDNLKKILNNTCKISDEEETMSKLKLKKTVMSAICGQ